MTAQSELPLALPKGLPKGKRYRTIPGLLEADTYPFSSQSDPMTYVRIKAKEIEGSLELLGLPWIKKVVEDRVTHHRDWYGRPYTIRHYRATYAVQVSTSVSNEQFTRAYLRCRLEYNQRTYRGYTEAHDDTDWYLRGARQLDAEKNLNFVLDVAAAVQQARRRTKKKQ